jgi:hypothetical protein
MITRSITSLQDQLVELEHRLFAERRRRGPGDVVVLDLEAQRSELAKTLLAERRRRASPRFVSA